jgi:REP element-mobilizing transposase RayT
MRPVSGFTVTRRNLPHWQDPGSIYFLTWRAVAGLILEPAERTLVLEAIRYQHGTRWALYVAVVMPDHVHVLARPLPISVGQPNCHDLGDIMHRVKGFSSHQINRTRRRKGSVWQDERYDRIVRDETEFEEKWNYTRNNPVKAGLAEKPEDYLWLYESVILE